MKDNSHEGTFRNAIYKSNKNSNSTITFSISGVIKLNSSLPKIKSTVTIDGTSSPDYTDIPVIEINCNGHNGLVLGGKSGGSVIEGLSITKSRNNGLLVKSNGNTIISNYIGVDLNGKQKGNKKNGICLCKSNDNIIGTNPTNTSGYASNVISGNCKNGIKLYKSSNNTIVSNFIGTNQAERFHCLINQMVFY